MNVSACLVTRGDVDMQPVIDSLPKEWEIVIWDNSGRITRSDGWAEVCTDLSVYERYAAIEYASHDLIYVQDDDCIVSDPQAIVDGLLNHCKESGHKDTWNCWPARVACNMPQEFRHDFYTDHALVGFGAAFHRDAPQKAFDRYGVIGPGANLWIEETDEMDPVQHTGMFFRCCDIVFTGLTPCVRVDVPHEDREMASDPNRMWKQPEHVAERQRMLDLVKRVRDAN